MKIGQGERCPGQNPGEFYMWSFQTCCLHGVVNGTDTMTTMCDNGGTVNQGSPPEP